MGRKQHPPGRAGTWIEVKVIKGRTYWYERTRVYLGAGQSRIDSKYLGPGPKRTPESVAAQLQQSEKAHAQNQSAEQKESVALNPKLGNHDGGQTEPLTLVTNRQK